MEAERNRGNKEEFARLINLSVDWIEKAIALFPKITETNLDHAGEQGDCYSLLGRTHHVAGNDKEADIAARKALEFLTDETTKDFADLQILFGDLAASSNPDAARSHYEKAIEVAGVTDAERSEIAARAYYEKGRVTKSVASLEKAAEIWQRLKEDSNAGKARWLSLVFAGRVPESARKVFDSVRPSVRVEAIRIHECRLASLTGPSRGRRSNVDKKYWEELKVIAAENVAIQQDDWEG